MEIDNTIINDKYIYLDWNVIKNMKEPRPNREDLDKRFCHAVFKLKKRYKFPYSIAHIMDRANHYDSAYYDKVRRDLEFAESINDTVCVGICKCKPFLVKQDMQTSFNEYISKPQKEPSFNNVFPFSCNIDINKIDVSHPMYDFFKENQSQTAQGDMSDFLQEVYKDIFQDINRYKKLRDYIKNHDLKNGIQAYTYSELMYLDKLLFHLFPFLDSFQDDEKTLANKWSKITEHWFSLYNEKLNQDLLLIQGYSLLDMHPLFNEKLKKGKNTLDNIVRDGNHCFYASEARYYVSEDEATRKKTAFLYKVYNKKTKVISEDSFLNIFTVD